MPRLSIGLTDKDIQSAKPKEKPYKLYDREGLCILIRSTGTKVWQYHYKYKNQRKTLTIGKYISKGLAGHVSLKDARSAKYEAKALLETGIDPSAHKQEILNGKKGANDQTFEALGREITLVDSNNSKVTRFILGCHLRKLIFD